MTSKSELKRRATLDPLWAAQRIVELEAKLEFLSDAIKNNEAFAAKHVDMALENARLREALKFYAQAKVLFLSIDGSMPDGGPLGLASGGQLPSMIRVTVTHIKDDGQVARKALGIKE